MAKGRKSLDTLKLREWIIKSVGKRPKTEKKVLFSECLNNFHLTEAERKDRSSDGKLARCKSVIGCAVAEMLREGLIELVDEYYYKLPDDVSENDIITEERIEEYFSGLFEKGGKYTKKEMFALCEKEFGCEKRGADYETLHRNCGNVLARLVKNGVLKKEKTGGKYFAEVKNEFPNSDLGNCLKEAAEGGDVKKCFLNALNLKGGEFFEWFSVNLIKKELERTETIIKSEIVGGAGDNGIDGIIECYDNFGFKDRVLIQARTRAKGTITLKELREFFGALNAEKGTRGIFASTASFHKEATTFANRQPNLVYLAGNKLYDLALAHGFGVRNQDTGVQIDYAFFLDMIANG